jgi:hypothetical protein
MRSILTILLFLVLAGSSLASDGVLEINQTCAVQTGCIDNSGDIGDTPGFPVNIEIPGSYILTSNLVVSDPNTSGLFIAAAPVTIDLNGFEIQGPVNCISLGSTLTCDAGTGSGIVSGSFRTTVLNGSVIKFGSNGIKLGGLSRIERVVVERNGGNGIDVGSDSIVTNCRAYRNGGDGIVAGDSSTVGRSTSASNRELGFDLGQGGVISASTARDNGGHGIFAFPDSTIIGNTVYGNEDDGISAFGAATIVSNTANSNQADGIKTGNGATVQQNTMRANGGYGLRVGLSSAYRENVITSNTDGAVVGNGVNLGDNYCNGTGVVSSSCP